MKRMLCALVVAAGCGGSDTDLTGVYQVETHVASMPCGADTAVTGGDPYLKFHKDDLFGAEFFTYDGCSDAAATACTSGNGFYPEPIDNGWKERVSTSSGGGGTCALGYTLATAVLVGNQLLIDSSSYTDTVQLADADCTTDEAEKRGTAMPCEMHEAITATRITE